MRRGLYTLEFEPVVQVGDIVKIIPKPKPEIDFWEIVWVDALPEKMHDFGALSAGAETKLVKIDFLALDEREFGQWRMSLLDDIEIIEFRYSGASASPKFATKGESLPITKNVPEHITEFFTWQDDEIYVKIRNPGKYDIDTSRVVFRGYVFRVTPFIGKPPAYTRILLGTRMARGVPA